MLKKTLSLDNKNDVHSRATKAQVSIIFYLHLYPHLQCHPTSCIFWDMFQPDHCIPQSDLDSGQYC